MLQKPIDRCAVHQRLNDHFVPKGSCECGPIANVAASMGADVNPLSFYSTTNSSTHVNWLPTLRKKFQLHLRTSQQSEYSADVSLTTPIRKESTGYTKNCSMYLPYDKNVDEKEGDYQ